MGMSSKFAAGCVVLGVVALGCSEPEPGTGEPASVETTATTAESETGATTESLVDDEIGDDGSIVASFAGESWFRGIVPSTAIAADESLEPIIVGMINQENSPVGSYPELRAAVEAAFAFANTELGGVDGRPIRLETCTTSFSVEESQACAQRLVQAGAVVVLSGIDVTSNGSVPILEQNGVPLIAGIPTNLAEYQSDNAFSFSGGVTGGLVAFADHAAANGAESIMFAFGEFESFERPVRDIAQPVAENLGLEVSLLPFPILTTDFLPILTRVVDTDPDAVVIAAADRACVPIVDTLADLGYQGQLYLVGACAAEQILAQIDDERQAAVIFNSEGPVDAGIEADLFAAVIDRYAVEPAGAGGTVTFRAAMNIWALLAELNDEISSATIATALRAARSQPSFWGHPYTCDGQQVPGYRALCAPQQTLFRMVDDSGNATTVVDDWVDVPSLVAGAVRS